MARFRIDGAFCLLAAALLLVLPLRWLAGAAAAAIFHELCHVASIRLCGGRLLSLRIGPGGAILETEPLSAGKELVCTLAGPAGSLALLFLIRYFPVTALCGAVQGIYNLLPVYPLDGGRALRCLIGENRAEAVERIFLPCLTLAGAVLTFAFQLGLLPLATAFTLALRAIFRKIPCKEGQLRVQ